MAWNYKNLLIRQEKLVPENTTFRSPRTFIGKEYTNGMYVCKQSMIILSLL